MTIKNNDNRLIWLNGEIINYKDAKMNVLTPGFQFGANVFEGIRCYWNGEQEQLYAFRLMDHYKRLFDSMKLFRMKNDYCYDDLLKPFTDVIKANEYKEDIAVRQTIFIDGYGSWFSQEPVGMFVAPIGKPRKKVPLENCETVCVSSWERISDSNMSPRIKVGANYINSRYAKLEARDNGYDSAIFLDRYGHVSEGPGSGFFMIKDGQLITPLLTDSVLNSITRDTVIHIAREVMDMEVIERSINRTELYTCDEAFFCGSAVEISPISRFDGYHVGNGGPGPITSRIHDEYINIVTGNNKEYRKWLYSVY